METHRIEAPVGYAIAKSNEDRSHYEGIVFDPKSGAWYPTAGERRLPSEIVACPSQADKLGGVHRMYRRRRNLMLLLLVVTVPFLLRIGWALCAYLLR